MNSFLEFKKIKRTGLFPAFVLGGMLAAAIPVLNLILQPSQEITSTQPIQQLIVGNWTMMSLLNTLLLIAGASVLYSIEYSDQALKKIKSLPIKESSLFFNKNCLLVILTVIVLLLELGAMTFAANHWFEMNSVFIWELWQHFGYFFLMNLPAIFLALMIASLFENIWVTLGINVTLVFLATMLYQKNVWFSLLPFALPLQIMQGSNQDMHRIVAAIGEVLFLSIAEILLIRVRRNAE